MHDSALKICRFISTLLLSVGTLSHLFALLVASKDLSPSSRENLVQLSLKDISQMSHFRRASKWNAEAIMSACTFRIVGAFASMCLVNQTFFCYIAYTTEQCRQVQFRERCRKGVYGLSSLSTNQFRGQPYRAHKSVRLFHRRHHSLAVEKVTTTLPKCKSKYFSASKVLYLVLSSLDI